MTPLCLGINLAVEPISVGLTRGQTPVALFSGCPGYSFSENLITEIDKIAYQNNQNLSDIQAIGIVNGPGSYTGLRISTTFAKTVCQLQSIPLYAFSTLEAFCYQYRFFDGTYLSVMPACRNEINAALLGVKNGTITRLTDDFTCLTDTLIKNIQPIQGKLYVIGVFNDIIKTALQAHSNLICVPTVLNGTTIAQMASDHIGHNKRGDYRKIIPCYSHQPQIGRLKE